MGLAFFQKKNQTGILVVYKDSSSALGKGSLLFQAPRAQHRDILALNLKVLRYHKFFL